MSARFDKLFSWLLPPVAPQVQAPLKWRSDLLLDIAAYVGPQFLEKHRINLVSLSVNPSNFFSKSPLPPSAYSFLVSNGAITFPTQEVLSQTMWDFFNGEDDPVRIPPTAANLALGRLDLVLVSFLLRHSQQPTVEGLCVFVKSHSPQLTDDKFEGIVRSLLLFQGMRSLFVATADRLAHERDKIQPGRLGLLINSLKQ